MLRHAQLRFSATLLKATAVGLLTLASLTTAQAADELPIRLVVPFPPGGSTAIAARIIQPKLPELLDRDVVIRSEEHTSTLHHLMRISYALFCFHKTTHSQH